MILDPEQTGHLPQVIREGEYYGMQTFDQHLLKHLQGGRVTYEEAMKVATSPHDFKLMCQADSKLRELTVADPNAGIDDQPTAPMTPVSESMGAPAPAPVMSIPAPPPPMVADLAPAGGSAPPPPSAAPPGM
jgi:twitching motility protein PilT